MVAHTLGRMNPSHSHSMLKYVWTVKDLFYKAYNKNFVRKSDWFIQNPGLRENDANGYEETDLTGAPGSWEDLRCLKKKETVCSKANK